MNFKNWLLLTESIHDPFKEAESNQLTQKLCDWIKTHNRNPSKKISMLGGTHTISGEISYNIDPEEVMLADFLQSRKTAKIININYFPTDEDILDKNNMSGLFDSKISNHELARELASNQKVKEIAIKYKELGEKGFKFNSFLQSKRAAYKDFIDGTKNSKSVWYPSDIIVARNNGLPDNWMLFQPEIKSNKQVEQLAIRYKQLGGKYPPEFRSFLQNKKMAYKDFIDGTKNTRTTWYPSDIIVARDNGLPDDWMLFIDLEIESNQKVKAIGIRYKELGGKYPPEFKGFLQRKRAAYKDYKDGIEDPDNTWYPSDIEIARDNGLPENWMLFIDLETESNQKVKALAIRYQELGGKYPPEFNDFLQKKRAAYRNYIYGTKNTTVIWYPSDVAIAKENGLPDDWMLYKHNDAK